MAPQNPLQLNSRIGALFSLVGVADCMGMHARQEAAARDLLVGALAKLRNVQRDLRVAVDRRNKLLLQCCDTLKHYTGAAHHHHHLGDMHKGTLRHTLIERQQLLKRRDRYLEFLRLVESQIATLEDGRAMHTIFGAMREGERAGRGLVSAPSYEEITTLLESIGEQHASILDTQALLADDAEVRLNYSAAHVSDEELLEELRLIVETSLPSVPRERPQQEEDGGEDENTDRVREMAAM